MLSSVLHSERAAQVNIAIMRAFVKMRAIVNTQRDLAQKVAEMEKKYDAQFRVVFPAIKRLMAPEPVPPSRRIGFTTMRNLAQPSGAGSAVPRKAPPDEGFSP